MEKISLRDDPGHLSVQHHDRASDTAIGHGLGGMSEGVLGLDSQEVPDRYVSQ